MANQSELAPGHKNTLNQLLMTIAALNVRHVAAVAATARLGSLSAAARAVSLTQPAISQAIANIERHVAQPLFVRRPDGMTPTEAGALLALRFDTALAHIASSRVTMAQFRALIDVADAGSYPDASAKTGLSQPTLHSAIGDLSIALCRDLVERRGRRIVLTDAGRSTVRGFRLARAELTAGLDEIATIAGRETGRIVVGAMPLSRTRVLPAAITAFAKRHPQAEVRVVEGSHAELNEPLRNGDIDVLIGALRETSPEGVTQTPLFEDLPVVLGRAGHPLAAKSDWPLEALTTYPWTISAPGTPLRILWEMMFRRAGQSVPQVPVECGSVITIRQILLDSDFLTLLSPDQVAVELEAGWLALIGQPHQELRRTIGTTVRSGWRPAAIQANFVTALSDAIRPAL